MPKIKTSTIPNVDYFENAGESGFSDFPQIHIKLLKCGLGFDDNLWVRYGIFG